MKIRSYVSADHPALVSWWEGHGFGVVADCLIPPFSWVVEDEDGVGLCFACAYLDNGGTGMAMMEWIVTNPENSPRVSLKAIRMLVPWMLEHLHTELDYGAVLVVCRQESLSRLLEMCGVPLTDTGVRHHLAVRKLPVKTISPHTGLNRFNDRDKILNERKLAGELREKGFTYSKIAKELGLTSVTMARNRVIQFKKGRF